MISCFLPVRAMAATGLNCNPCAITFGSVVVGQTETVPTTLTNTQTTSVTISAATVDNSVFKTSNLRLPLTLAAGKSTTFNVVFSPNQKTWEGGKVTLTSNASNRSLVVTLGGVGVSSQSLKASPTSLGFGNVSVGSTARLSMTLTNSGTSDLIVGQADLTGTAFGLSGLVLPLRLSPKASSTFTVTFTPQSATSMSGSLYLPNGKVTIALTGTGTNSSQGQLSLNPASLQFGSVDVGNTGVRPLTLSASGASVTVSSTSSSSALFALDGVTLPLTIGKGQSVSVNVAFTPQNSGAASGTLTIVSNASNSRATEGMSGTGVLPSHSVNLSWNASTSSVAGYNIYRGTSLTGTYTKINSFLEPATTYTDTTVVSGKTYYYAATSVDSAGRESNYSTSVKAVIP